MILPQLSGVWFSILTPTHVVFPGSIILMTFFFVPTSGACMTRDNKISMSPAIATVIFLRATFTWWAIVVLYGCQAFGRNNLFVVWSVVGAYFLGLLKNVV